MAVWWPTAWLTPRVSNRKQQIMWSLTCAHQAYFQAEAWTALWSRVCFVVVGVQDPSLDPNAQFSYPLPRQLGNMAAPCSHVMGMALAFRRSFLCLEIGNSDRIPKLGLMCVEHNDKVTASIILRKPETRFAMKANYSLFCWRGESDMQ